MDFGDGRIKVGPEIKTWAGIREEARRAAKQFQSALCWGREPVAFKK
jgi:hypothetical protein